MQALALPEYRMAGFERYRLFASTNRVDCEVEGIYTSTHDGCDYQNRFLATTLDHGPSDWRTREEHAADQLSAARR
jgi:hypothetical protein